MQDVQNVSTDSEADDGEDIQNVCEKDEKQGLIQLHLSAELGDTEAVRNVLMSSANVDVLDTKHNTPLHIATLNGHIDVVNLLLSKNASVDSRNALGQTSLHLAAKIGHLAITQILLDINADVHVTDQFMNTPIHIAAMHGHCELVQLLMNHSALLICYGNRPLHLAAQRGHTEVAQLLLNYCEHPDATNLDGDTPLHLASENGKLEVVETLLSNNADVNIHNALGKTSLHIAADMGYADIVKAMIDHEGEVNAVDENGDTALHYAAWNGHCAVVNVLLNQTTGMDAQIRFQFTADEFELSQNNVKSEIDLGHTSHPIEAEDDNFEIAETLLSHPSTANAVCKGQATPLRLAFRKEYSKMAKNLIFNGVNVNACNNAKRTALHLACQSGHTSVVEILLDSHATVDVTKQSEETPLYIAAKNGHADISDLLLRRGVCDFVQTDYIETPLQVAVKEGHTQVVEVILKHSCRISEKLTKDGKNLQENAKRGVMPVELMKSDGRRVSAEIVWTEINTPLEIKRDLYGNAPLVRAALLIDPKMVQLLLSVDQCVDSEIDIAERFWSIITNILPESFTHFDVSDAIKYRMNFRKLVQFLINSNKFNVNHQGWELNTFLHDVIRQKRKHSSYGCFIKDSDCLTLHNLILNDLVQLLLEKGADFNLKNHFGETPLTIASQKGCCQAIQLLFDWEQKSGIKLDIDARDQYGATALIKAAERNHGSVVRLLLSRKVSVKLYDYRGFTALHAAVYDLIRMWFDLHFFCKGFRKRKFSIEDYPQIDYTDNLTRNENPLNRIKAIYQLGKILEHDENDTRIKEEMVKLLLDNDETNVNAIDFGGNTPLDMAVKSSKRITLATFEALKNRGAIQNLLEPKDERPIEMARVDERGRNPLHRLIISHTLHNGYEDERAVTIQQNLDRFYLMRHGILLREENFRHLAAATDDKGRTPLHYAVMPQFYTYIGIYARNLVNILFKLGSNVNAPDVYGKTPLHYAENNNMYKLIVWYGADENIKDKHGHTPRDLKQLRESVTMNEGDKKKLPIGKKTLYTSINIAKVLHTNHVTELTKRKLVETIRIYSQSPRPQESSEEAVWKIWTENEPIRLNRRLNLIKPLIHQFIERLADGIKERDWRFECQPMLVGSAEEETKVVFSGDFDFSFKLIKFSQICDPFPHPLGPKGYFQLSLKPNEDAKGRSDGNFTCFFNSDQCLMTNEVNSRFHILVEDVVKDPKFLQNEYLFEWYWSYEDNETSINEQPAGLCKTVRLRMINPIDDGEGGFLFVNISVDIVACVHGGCSWLDDLLPDGKRSVLNTEGCIFVFDRPRFDPSKPNGGTILFSETLARISFAPLESRIIKESSLLMKAAYTVCKMILYEELKTTYQLKTSLLFCMEALNGLNGSETRKEDEFTPKQLAFWVERIMFCFMEFSRHGVYPCYFMPSFRQRAAEMSSNIHFGVSKDIKEKEVDVNLSYSTVYDLYLDLCPDDTAVDIPIDRDGNTEGSLNANHDPNWEQFSREEFIRKLSSRGFRLPAN